MFPPFSPCTVVEDLVEPESGPTVQSGPPPKGIRKTSLGEFRTNHQLTLLDDVVS